MCSCGGEGPQVQLVEGQFWRFTLGGIAWGVPLWRSHRSTNSSEQPPVQGAALVRCREPAGLTPDQGAAVATRSSDQGTAGQRTARGAWLSQPQDDVWGDGRRHLRGGHLGAAASIGLSTPTWMAQGRSRGPHLRAPQHASLCPVFSTWCRCDGVINQDGQKTRFAWQASRGLMGPSLPAGAACSWAPKRRRFRWLLWRLPPVPAQPARGAGQCGRLPAFSLLEWLQLLCYIPAAALCDKGCKGGSPRLPVSRWFRQHRAVRACRLYTASIYRIPWGGCFGTPG